MLNLVERVNNKISTWYPTWVLLTTTIQTLVSHSLCQAKAKSNNQKYFSALLKTSDKSIFFLLPLIRGERTFSLRKSSAGRDRRDIFNSHLTKRRFRRRGCFVCHCEVHEVNCGNLLSFPQWQSADRIENL